MFGRKSRSKNRRKQRQALRRRNSARLWLLLFVMVVGFSGFVFIVQHPGETFSESAAAAFNDAADRFSLWYARKRADAARSEADYPNEVSGDPASAGTLLELSSLRQTVGQYTASLPDFEDTFKLPETDILDKFSASHMRALALRAVGKNEEAFQALEEVFTTSAPETVHYEIVPRALLLRADLEMRLPANRGGGPQAAARTYKQFLDSAGNQPGIWATERPRVMQALADCLRRAGRKKEALAAYDECLAQYPNHPAGALVAMKRLQLGRQERRAGAPSAAQLRKILEQYPGDTGASQHVHYELANAYLLAGDIDQAIKILGQIRRFKPLPGDDDFSPELAAQARLDLAVLLGQQGRIKAQQRILQEILKRFPEQPQARQARTILDRTQRRRD